jgi:UDP-GlcNAc3NAcA epimerase
MKKIITIVGARPQIIKSSAISRAISTVFQKELEEIIVHTGQHYDENMSDIFFNEMSIPRPKYNLNVGSGGHGAQTAKMLEGLEKIFLDESPTAVLVYGDTNSTIAGALAASKIHIPVIHVEAGLRSFNKRMPEEVNRIACDHMSTMLFTPTSTGLQNLQKEGFSLELASKISSDQPMVLHCGDVMYDNSLYFSKVSAENSTILADLHLVPNEYILCTIHRDANTDIAANLNAIFRALLKIQSRSNDKVVLPLHPRTKKQMDQLLTSEVKGQLANNLNIKIIDPAGFLDIIALEKNSKMIITDSGGLQKESFFFQKPCVILRPQTEWVEIVENGNAILADHDEGRILAAFDHFESAQGFSYPSFYGDGKAAEFICQQIVNHL